jgi:hypothetical protein
VTSRSRRVTPEAAGAALAATAALIRRAVTTVVFVIAGLSFAFGFGNGWQLGLFLGVPWWIAPLVAPAVDLSVVALLTTVNYLRSNGVGARMVGPRCLLVLCGLITFAVNTAEPLIDRQYGRACFDAVAPLLLIGWSEVGPGLLALLHHAVPDRPQSADGRQDSADDRPMLPPELVKQARGLDVEHRKAAGRPITRDKLRAQLGVSNAIAGELLRRVRSPDTAYS